MPHAEARRSAIMSRNDVTALSRETLDIQIDSQRFVQYSREPDLSGPKMDKRAATTLSPSDYDLPDITWSNVFKGAQISEDDPIAKR